MDKITEIAREIDRLEALIELLVGESVRIWCEADVALLSAFEEAFAAFKEQMEATIAPEDEAS